jgi:hypothetical protein
MTMEPITAFPTTRPDRVIAIGPDSHADATRTLTVTATYALSEDGRKASLLAGGDGRAVQHLAVEVPMHRLHLITVDPDGIARLKLRPSFHVDHAQRVVRTDAPPTYDAPPDIETLFRDAARNHQLERTYRTDRRDAQTARRDAEVERRGTLAEAFLADPTQRAMVHPAPTPTRCDLATPLGRVRFDATDVDMPGRDVPREAHRRFRADLSARHAQHCETRAAELLVHEEKRRLVAAWIAAYGTSDQQARQAAGVLPIPEAIEAMTDHAFAGLRDRPVYARDGARQLQTRLRQDPTHADVVITPGDVVVTSRHASTATAAQWSLVEDLRRACPTAAVVLRAHRIAWKPQPSAPTVTVFGVLVTLKRGPFTLRREFAAPGGQFAERALPVGENAPAE